MVHGNDKYTDEIGNEIIDLYSSGMNIVTICSQLNIPERTLYDWLERIDAFAQRFHIARLNFATTIAEDTINLANDRDPQRSRVKIQVNQWLASKYNPAIYGDHVQVKIEHSVDLSLALEQAQSRIEGRIPTIEHDDDLLD